MCFNNICTSTIANGDKCTYSDECTSKRCSEKTCKCNYKCENIGDVCEDDKHCVSGSFCLNNVCTAKKEENGSCTKNYECISNACVGGKCTCYSNCGKGKSCGYNEHCANDGKCRSNGCCNSDVNSNTKSCHPYTNQYKGFPASCFIGWRSSPSWTCNSANFTYTQTNGHIINYDKFKTFTNKNSSQCKNECDNEERCTAYATKSNDCNIYFGENIIPNGTNNWGYTYYYNKKIS